MTETQYKVYLRLKGRLESRAEEVYARYVKLATEVLGPKQTEASPYAHFEGTEESLNGNDLLNFRRDFNGGDFDSYSIPLRWLWDPEWETVARESLEEVIAKEKEKLEAKAKAERERELRMYKQLKAKFE